jgi:hypothetical protein
MLSYRAPWQQDVPNFNLKCGDEGRIDAATPVATLVRPDDEVDSLEEIALIILFYFILLLFYVGMNRTCYGYGCRRDTKSLLSHAILFFARIILETHNALPPPLKQERNHLC